MPVQETSAKLWHETEEQKQAYDELMISNIELKESDNPESPYFSYLAARSKKEKFPTYSEKYFDAVNKIMTIDDSPKRLLHSYKYFHEWTLEKYFIGMGLGYFVLRELPIRNFYARSLIMAFIGMKVYSNYRVRGLHAPTQTNMVLDVDPDLF